MYSATCVAHTIRLSCTNTCKHSLILFGDGSISDWAADVDSRRSHTGYIIMRNGGAVSWKSRRQDCVSLSTSVSELGLAQCEDSFPTTKTKRTVTSVSIVYWKQGVFNNNEGGPTKVLEGEEKSAVCLQQRTSGRFTTRTEDLCTVQQKAIVQCPLVGSSGRQNLGQNEACWVAPALSARDSRASSVLPHCCS